MTQDPISAFEKFVVPGTATAAVIVVVLIFLFYTMRLIERGAKDQKEAQERCARDQKEAEERCARDRSEAREENLRMLGLLGSTHKEAIAKISEDFSETSTSIFRELRESGERREADMRQVIRDVQSGR